jgi:hypothetical protein
MAKRLKLRDIVEMVKDNDLDELILVATKSHGHTNMLVVPEI